LSPHPIHAPWNDDPAIFASESIETWRKFTQTTYRSDLIVIVEGMFFQNTPRLLMQQDMDLNQIKTYVEQVEAIVVNLNPVLLYFRQTDVPSSIKHICSLRGTQWQSYFVGALTENPYSTRRGLKGMAGAITFMETYNELCKDLFSRLAMKKKAIDNAGGNWKRCYEEITHFLELH
jgi:hypothetical protein